MRRILTLMIAILCTLTSAAPGGPLGSNYDSPGQRARAKQIADARSQINRVMIELRRDFEGSSELRDARSSFHRVAADYRAACEAAIEPLQTSLPYKQQAQRVLDLETKVKAAHSDNRTGDRELAALVAELLRARQELSKLEAAAIASDAAATAARFAMQDANGKLVWMTREFNASIAFNAQYIEARARLDAVRGVPR